MDIKLDIGRAPRTTALAQQIATMRGGCVGCDECRGICPALIEAMTLPGAVLGARDDA